MVRKLTADPIVADDFEPLTAEERARLRPLVDVAALERLLARLPRNQRHLNILSFTTRRPPSEVREALREARALTDGLDAYLQMLIDHPPLPPHLAHPENDPDDNWEPRAWENMQFMWLIVEPPFDDPELTALWHAIEPREGKFGA